MAKFEYTVAPFRGKGKEQRSVAEQLENIINAYAEKGWEFVGMHDVTIEIPPGCIGGLLGGTTTYTKYDEIIFKRPVS
jgi:hypothetical protein